MRIGNFEFDIIEAITTYESGIEWKSQNNRVFGIDYGMETDHFLSKIKAAGDRDYIATLRDYLLGFISSEIWLHSQSGEKPFGPAFEDGNFKGIILEVGDLNTDDKGLGEFDFVVGTTLGNLIWAYSPVPFNLSNFMIQSAERENSQDSNYDRLLSGWTAHRHDWTKKRLSIKVIGFANRIGEAFRWLLIQRTNPFSLNCNNSMILIDGFSQNVALLSLSNIKRVENSGLWSVDMDFAGV